MIVDGNTFIGNWAFRRLRKNDTASVVGMLDQFGLDKACVASADAILYRNSHAGNEKLFEETRGYEERLWLLATLNPLYAGWERDLARCVGMGFRGLRLYPCYHGYELDSKEAGAIIDAAAEAGLPVTLPCRVEDIRQRHWMDTAKDLEPGRVLQAAEAHPKATFVLTEAILGWAPEADEWRRARAVNFFVELSRMTSVLGKDIKVAVDALGAERVVFGTGFPFKTPSPAFLKLQALDADDRAKMLIAGGNAERLFGNA